MDDTFVALTERRLIAIDRRKRPPGKRPSWRTRLNLERLDGSKGKHAVVFEATREGLLLSVQLGIFYLARLKARTIDGRTFSIGLNSRYWARQAVILCEEMGNTDFETETIS